MKIKKTDVLILTLFIFLTFFLRMGSFSQSVIDQDESLYLLMSRSFIEGQPPYTEFFDNKPIGIYVLFSLALLIFGKSVLSIRIAACIAVSITCYLLYRLGKLIEQTDIKVGLLAGILYAVISLGSGGIASNTEIFFTPFVVLAFYWLFTIIVRPNRPIHHNSLKLFLIGLSMGIGLQIKQVVIFEFLAILLLIGIALYFQDKQRLITVFTGGFKCYAILFIGLILPSFITLLYYIFNGHFEEFYYANFSANIARVGGEKWSLSNFGVGFLIQIKTNLLLWLCLLLTPFYWVYSQDSNSEEKRNLTYLVIWFAMAFLGVCAPKNFYPHYFLQVLPSLCLLSSYIIIKTVWAAREIGAAKRFLMLALILVTPLLNIAYPYVKAGIKVGYFRYVKGIENWGDNPAIVAKYLKERVKSEDYIYVVDYSAIIYFLVPAKVPTKYAYPPFLIPLGLARIARVQPIEELRSILAKRPVYVIKTKKDEVQREPFYKELDESLKKNYFLEKNFSFETDFFEEAKKETEIIELYRLKTSIKN